MKAAKVIGIDLAKNIFYIHGVDEFGRTVIKRKLTRSKMIPFFANLPSCLIGIEAGAGAHYWARELLGLGHDTKIMAPQFVKPYVKSNKTDQNDAEAICEAVTRPSMRFVNVKTKCQQDIQSVHRIRERLVKSKTSLACEIRGFLAEYGVIVPKGLRELRRKIPEILSDESSKLTPYSKELIQELFSELEALCERIKHYDKKISMILSKSDTAKRLMTIPGVGPLAATAIIASVADPSLFKSGREFAAYLGLVPKQSSSGGKQKLLGISKRGDYYIRTMLIHGARTVVNHVNGERVAQHGSKEWIKGLRERRGYCKTAVALANKNARICWALMSKEENYKAVA